MKAKVGDTILVKCAYGTTSIIGEIVEVRGDEGYPPYFVKFEDGHQTLIYPTPDTEVIPAETKRKIPRKKE